MTLRAIVTLLAFAASAWAAPVPKELKSRDYERFQGSWTFESYDRGGREIGGGRWFFEGNRMYAGGQNTTDQKGTEFGFELRPNRCPAELDICYEQTVRCSGIYEFVGDELHIAYFHGAQRPKDFSSAEGKDVFSIRRAPEAKK